MRSTRLLAAGLLILAVAACETSTPGWTYAPASPSAVPSAGPSASVAPSGSPAASPSPSAAASPPASASASASGAPSGSAPAGATVVQVAAQNIAFDPTQLSVPAGQPFRIEFANNDPGILHNVEIKDAAGTSIFQGEVFPGVATRTYDAPALPAGTYQFVCTVHPNMVGTLAAQ